MSVRTPDPTDVFVGGRVRIARVYANKSQTELADAIGVTFQQVQKYEKGVNRIGPSRLQKIADFVQRPVSWFFDEAADDSPKQAADKDIVSQMLVTPGGVDMARFFIAIKEHKARTALTKVAQSMAEAA